MANTHALDLELSSSQYASITDASQTGLDLSGDFTIEAWIKPESFDGTTERTIVSKSVDGSSNGYKIAVAGSFIRCLIGQTALDTTRDLVTQSTTFNTGTYYHIAVTCDISNATATTFEFFVNGVSIGNGDTLNVSGNCSSINNSTAPFIIGARGNIDRFFDGLVDEVRVWNDIRTQQEIEDNMSVQLEGNEAGLVGYWRLNNNYEDLTSNNNDLTATNNPVFSTDVPFGAPTSGGNPMFFSTGGNTLG